MAHQERWRERGEEEGGMRERRRDFAAKKRRMVIQSNESVLSIFNSLKICYFQGTLSENKIECIG